MGEFLLRRVKLIVDKSNEPLILEEDESLEDILIRLESISHRIDDIQCSLIKKRLIARFRQWSQLKKLAPLGIIKIALFI